MGILFHKNTHVLNIGFPIALTLWFKVGGACCKLSMWRVHVELKVNEHFTRVTGGKNVDLKV